MDRRFFNKDDDADDDDDDDDDVVVDDDVDNVSIVEQHMKTLPVNCAVCVQGVLRSATAGDANGDCLTVAIQLLLLLPMTTTPTIEYCVG